MNGELFRYTFSDGVLMLEVEATLHLAVLAIESLYGESSVRLGASFAVDAPRRSCVIDGSTKVGRAISRVFTGLSAREFGDRSFKVRRLRSNTHRSRGARR